MTPGEVIVTRAAAAGEVMGGSALASWRPVVILLSIVGAAIVLLWVRGEPGDHPSPLARLLLRGPNRLARLTGLPAWAAAGVMGTFAGLLIAGYGFVTDVNYHMAYGRDEILFTAPHTAIFVGLCTILTSALLGIATAHLSRAGTGTRLSGIEVPWSLLPLLVLGTAAVLAFPVDELWHARYGVDVTMWSPPHMLMIMGAALTGTALWLILAEAGARPRDDWRFLALHALTATAAIQALNAPLGEFELGIPQFQQLYHPVVVMIASGALVAARLVLGRGWTLGVLAVSFGVNQLDRLLLEGTLPVQEIDVAVYVGSALVIELVALALGTRRTLRFAVVSGLGVGTIGLATEWWWNATMAWQPWNSALLPDAVVVGLPAALATTVVAAAYGGALTRRPGLIPGWAVVAGLVTVAVALAVPFPRDVGDVTAQLTVDDHGNGTATVRAELDPPDAAADARWFFAGAWQGGGNTVSYMQHLGDGRYVSERPIEIDGAWKSLLRLHRGSEMMAIPIRMPADPEFDLEALPAEDRVMAFRSETEYLLREATDGPPGLGIAVRLLYAALAVAWLTATIVACRHIARLEVPADAEAREPTTSVWS